MENSAFEWSDVQKLLDELIEGQNKSLLFLGRRIVPTLTSEDMLQPNDYAELEHHPEFRYEEGVLAGMRMVQMALQASVAEMRQRGSFKSVCDEH
jgi:hypothetical protein